MCKQSPVQRMGIVNVGTPNVYEEDYRGWCCLVEIEGTKCT